MHCLKFLRRQSCIIVVMFCCRFSMTSFLLFRLTIINTRASSPSESSDILSHERNERHIAHLCEEVRRNVEKSEWLKPSDQSIENNMLRYLPDGMTNDQIYAYYNAKNKIKL
jgi:hypothetical protein